MSATTWNSLILHVLLNYRSQEPLLICNLTLFTDFISVSINIINVFLCVVISIWKQYDTIALDIITRCGTDMWQSWRELAYLVQYTEHYKRSITWNLELSILAFCKNHGYDNIQKFPNYRFKPFHKTDKLITSFM